MKLMEGDNGEDGIIGIKDLSRWPSNSDAVGFVSATTSASSLDELRKVTYLFAFFYCAYVISMHSFQRGPGAKAS